MRRVQTNITPGAASEAMSAHVGGVTAAITDLSTVIADRTLGFILSVVALSFLLLMLAYRSLVIPLKAAVMNLLSIGEEFAVSRGVDLRRMRSVCFVGGSLITAAVVAICGPIGFVGLVCPHACRLLFGPDHRRLVPAALLVGGTFLLACDTLARMALPGSQIPLGVVTSLVGAPVFIWLLARHATAKAI